MPNRTFSVRHVWLAASLNFCCLPRLPLGGGAQSISGSNQPLVVASNDCRSLDQFLVLYFVGAQLLMPSAITLDSYSESLQQICATSRVGYSARLKSPYSLTGFGNAPASTLSLFSSITYFARRYFNGNQDWMNSKTTLLAASCCYCVNMDHTPRPVTL